MDQRQHAELVTSCWPEHCPPVGPAEFWCYCQGGIDWGGYGQVTGVGLWAGSSAGCTLVPASLAHTSWSGVCMVPKGEGGVCGISVLKHLSNTFELFGTCWYCGADSC